MQLSLLLLSVLRQPCCGTEESYLSHLLLLELYAKILASCEAYLLNVDEDRKEIKATYLDVEQRQKDLVGDLRTSESLVQFPRDPR